MKKEMIKSGVFICSSCEESFEVLNSSGGKGVCFSPCCGARLMATLRKGDLVCFNIGRHKKTIHKVLSDEYYFFGRKVVDLEGCSGEVAVAYLKLVKRGDHL